MRITTHNNDDDDIRRCGDGSWFGAALRPLKAVLLAIGGKYAEARALGEVAATLSSVQLDGRMAAVRV